VTWTAPDVSRADPPYVNGERDALQAWLDYHRATLLVKCQGLTGEQLVMRAAEPSSLSLLGLVRHMTEVERGWFRRFVGKNPAAPPLYYSDDEDPDGDFNRTDPTQAEADFAAFRSECALADEAARGRSLDDTFPSRRDGSPIDLRWVYLHMIEEYARHNGHADLLRERIDGVTGD
jgi:uncharacterized damage-inducible protein DinB